MGLLVAGITGGASLVENARITSLKREVDDHVKDVFTFYARVGRLPGDLDNTGRIGFTSEGSVSTANSYSEPYNIAGISVISGPFIELYLYGVSSFKPTTDPAIIVTSDKYPNMVTIANGGGIPFSKVYRDAVFVHRYENDNGGANSFSFGMYRKTAMGMFTSINSKMAGKMTIELEKKIDTKFDDGIYNGGNIRGYCDGGSVSYANATVCSEMMFYFDVK
jgi:hypothetical protein